MDSAVNATTTITVLRGTETNGYGDEVDNATVAASGIPASIIEQTRFTEDPTSDSGRTVRYVVGRLYHGTDVRPGDRVRDEGDSTIYIVDSVTSPQHAAIQPDVRLELRRVTA
jgi:hypothetical protein